MKTFFLFSITVLLFSCTEKNNTKQPNHNNTSITLKDTSESNMGVLNEDSHYIGFVEKFFPSKENEVYIELYLNKANISDDEYRQLEKLADSLIYSDDENSRHKFPTRLSPKHFDLRGLSKLAVYDKDNTFVCDANFVRVEYLSETISSNFIAVYKTGKKNIPDNCYAISNFDKKPETINYSIITDTLLTQKILKKLNAAKSYNGLEYSGTHYQFKDDKTRISVINSESHAYIVFVTGEELKVVYKSTEPENITSLQVIPILKNKFPYLLTKGGTPESDVIWTTLLYYDGTNYSTVKQQRAN